MTTKLRGAEIWSFWKEGWDEVLGSSDTAEAWCHDCDEGLDVEGPDGKCLLEMDKVYAAEDLGVIAWQGAGVPTMYGKPVKENVYDLVDVAAKWLRKQAEAIVVVRVPKADIDKFTTLCKERGWRIEK